jgi:hypothetical protein
MLNLGGAIAPGTSVTCLICAQAFAAAPVAVATTAPARATPAVSNASKPQAGILVSKPHAAVKPQRTSAIPQPSSPVGKAANERAALWLVTLSLLVVLATGAGFAIWKFNDAERADFDGNLGQAIAANPLPASQPKNGDAAVPASPDKGKGITTDKAPPPAGDPPDDDDSAKIKEAQKPVLKRKPSANAGAKDTDFDPVTTVNPAAPSVPGVEPARVNTAVEKGVAYLNRTQGPNGAWPGGMFPVGSAALAGLTLLECKTPPNDLHVQRAAFFVRSGAGTLSMTYEISLTILFLDRLGDRRDRALIQGLALRLLAGQRECGGWTYDCPPLSAQEMYQLFRFLHSYKTTTALPTKKDKGPALTQATKKPNKGTDPFNEFGQMIAEKEPANDPKDPPAADKKTQPGAKPTPVRPGTLPAHLRNLPVVRNQEKTKGNLQVRIGPGAGDNSNTQFALLALWAARRHEVVSDAALLTAYQRFVVSQNLDFGWAYVPSAGPGESQFTMNPVGLLGLAMGHGVAPDIVKVNPNDPKDLVTKPALQDPKIATGLKTLAKSIGNVSPDKDNVGGVENLYFLWSVERVAMLYDLKTIDGKDWYGWGAQKLLKHQNAQGDFPNMHYPGHNPHVNTCFALLFLKRSNLVQDLTLHLRLVTKVHDSEK